MLLIDVKQSSLDSNGDSEGRNGGSSSPMSASTTNEAPKKMLVMKRNPNPVANTSTKSNSSKQQLSAEEREKAYNEARARIFGESAEGSVSTESESAKVEATENSTLISAAVSNSPSPPPCNTANLPKTKCSGSLDGSNSAVESVRQTNSSSDLQELDGEEQESSKSSEGRSKKQIDPSSWKGTRGQVRNFEAEKNDPDFARRSNAAPRRNNRNNGGNYSNSGRDNNYRGDRGDRGGQQPSYYGNASYNNTQQYNPYMYGMSQATNSIPTAPGIMSQQSNPYYSPYNMDAPFLPPPPPPTLVTPQAPPFTMPPAYDPRNMYPSNNGRGAVYGDEYSSRSNQSPRFNSNANASLNKTDFPPLS